MFVRFIKFLVFSGLILLLIALVSGLSVGTYYYIRLTRDLPRIDRLSDYEPQAVTSILSADGQLVGEQYEQLRYPVPFEEIPLTLRHAFIAAEDSNFYQHPGIDLISIARAVWVNYRNRAVKQGASTITQQLVKSLLLTREKTYERKIKEAILAYRLERSLSKDEILEIYLNEIYLGSRSYGVKAAAKVFFHKSLDQLTIAESAFLAGLPQKPGYLSRTRNRKDAIARQRYVLQQMLKNEMITQEQHREAQAQDLVIYRPEDHDGPYEDPKILEAPYFVSHVRAELEQVLRKVNPRWSASDPGGFVVHTTLDLGAYELARKSLRKNLREVDKRRGWRGPLEGIKLAEGEVLEPRLVGADKVIKAGEVYRAEVLEVNSAAKRARVRLGDFFGSVDLSKSNWARRFLDDKGNIRWVRPERLLEKGDYIEVVLNEDRTEEFGDIAGSAPLLLDQTPELQSAMTVLNALTGEVVAIIGGFDYRTSVFNRATQGLLQPGSAFKPFIYLASLETLGYTPSTIVPDQPISMVSRPGEIWSPQNYDREFLGSITLRTALQRSRNVVSVYLLQRVGIDRAIGVARRLGISTPISRNMSISLGTPEVKQIELVRAYGAFATGGWLADQIIISKIEDRNGEVVYQKKFHQEKVIEESHAFIMANMMKGVVERGTAQRVKALKRPVAGKTGTTNDLMDAWFVGYTPEWCAGVWVGFDVKKKIGSKETGGRTAAPAFVYFMEDFLSKEPKIDFSIPEDVIPVPVDLASGRLVSADAENAFFEYFISGTEPTQRYSDLQAQEDYLLSSDF